MDLIDTLSDAQVSSLKIRWPFGGQNVVHVICPNGNAAYGRGAAALDDALRKLTREADHAHFRACSVCQTLDVFIIFR